MTSGQPEDADKTKREQRQRRTRIVSCLFISMLGVPPLLNSLDNPRLHVLHGVDFLRLFASGLIIGFGSGLLLSKGIFSKWERHP
jgi:hypothetical protein